MEAEEILSNFMDITNDRSDFFRYNLASNAVLDWFGRTIKGNECIERFLQCDVWPQYEQNFVAALTCDPIETRSTHEIAKETPMENAILCTPSETPSASGYKSPPPSKRNLEKPPPLRRNKKFKRRVKEYATASSDSDDEIASNQKSYNLRRLADGSESQSNNVINTSPKRGVRMLRKRTVEVPVASNDRSTSPMKRTKKMLDSFNAPVTASSSVASCSSSNAFSKPYSELKYLESIGSIRTIRRAKHPNINIVPTTKAITATPFVSPESQNGWDRKTKLKISYRTGLQKKNDIQFALIIYEPLKMVTRRNLLEEFEQAALEEEQQNGKATPKNSTQRFSLSNSCSSVHLKTPTMRTKPKSDKISSLRRLRF